MSDLNEAVATGRARAEEHMPELEAAYARLLRAGGRTAALNFRQQVVTAGVQEPVTVTAAVDPWQPPTGDLVDGDELAADATAAIAPIHRRILKAVSPADLGIAFDVKHPTSQALLAGIGKRLGSIPDAIRTQVNETVAEGHASGWSVAKTAGAIRAKVDEVTPGRAAMLARTDLNAISNGAAVSAGLAVGATTKTWKTAEDDLVRPDHADADGQTVPIDQPFEVGGEQGDFPASPDFSDAQSANCRCVAIIGGDFTASSDPFLEEFARAMTEPITAEQMAAQGPTKLVFTPTPEGGEMTDEPIVADKGDQETLAVLRETFGVGPDVFSDAELTVIHSLMFAARSKHKYAGNGGKCAICGETAADKDAHFQVLTAGITEFTIVAAAGPGEPTRWVAPAIAVENQPTEDGRVLMLDSTTWRSGTLPLGVMLDTPHGDISSAPLCGGIDTFERIGPVISAGGFFNDHLDPTLAPDMVAAARQAIEGIQSGTLTGISVDLMVMDGRMIEESALNKDGEDELPPEVEEDLAPGYPTVEDPDGDGDIDVGDDGPAGRLLSAVYQGVIGGACVVPVPAIGNASIAVVAAGAFERYIITTPLAADCGCGDIDVHVSLVAAAAPLAPPKEWFENPGLSKPTPITVTDDGRLFGHAALWSSCHEGYAGRCVPPPRSRMGYAKFHNGEMVCADGSRLSVGKFTLAAGHAGTRGVSEAAARAHYDNTATIGAFVRAGEDAHGIWISGALKSNLPPELIVDLRASPPSGDWRNGELVAAHAVIDPGFPVLRASGLGELFEEDEVEEPVSALSYLKPARRKVA